ncbi:hypothetical protein [Streptomyces sp. NPDC006971]|uniref:hypothetical protein n=1 Tax=Streptomyces sp. NPDC006971 TaxID=3154784 RepID=UPI00340A6B77
MTEEEAPGVGEAVHDTVRDRFGRVVGHEGRCLRISPLGSGPVWDAEPGQLRVLTRNELLSALVAEANGRSRQGR